jgi:hypothetical protein
MALVAGCIIPYPHTSLRSSEVSGTVLDAATHLPIKGAKVVESEDPGFPTGKTRRRISDAAGRFRFTASHNFHLATIGPEGADLPHGSEYKAVTVIHPGYLSYEIDGWGGNFGASVEVLLQPARLLDIRGRLLDRETKAPVVGARVVFDDYPRLATVSDFSGRFRLTANDDFYRAYEASEHHWPFRDSVSAVHTNYGIYSFHCGETGDILLYPKH